MKQFNTLEFFSDKCVNCKNCIRVCPQRVFGVKDNKVHCLKKDHCMECGACQLNCPVDAIKVNKGVGCAFAFLNGWINGTPPNCDCDSGCC